MNRVTFCIAAAIAAICSLCPAQTADPGNAGKSKSTLERWGILKRKAPTATPSPSGGIPEPPVQPEGASSTNQAKPSSGQKLPPLKADASAKTKPKPQSATTKSEPKASTAAPKKGMSATHSASTDTIMLSSWPTGKKLVALTYDDGPHPKFTPILLDMLAEKKVKATFFLLGQQIKEFPKVAARTVAEGHELANHTYDHKSLPSLSEDKIVQELTRTEDLLTSVAGQRGPLMRPPYGASNPKVREICRQLGYRVILWDIDTNDWRGRPTQHMKSNILTNAQDGSIILMHDRYQSSIDASAAVIDELRSRGFEFVTVSEMLSHPRIAAKSVTQGEKNRPADVGGPVQTPPPANAETR
ncbi:MAG: polysaccharide deacetylase family protein [Candidatus Sumerlaeaceae bacterium]|nr:polysaccharide deacetylase family protein [Candidatus Sumerlaeaceae bacterium]